MTHHRTFQDKTIIVTGGGSGIGRETAVAFAEKQGNVVVADIDREGGNEAVNKIKNETDGDAVFVDVDVTEEDDIKDMIDAALDNYGSLEIAFNNAGIGGNFLSTADINEQKWSQVIDVNLTGVWRCMKHEINEMKDRGGGAIVNTSSILGKVGFPEAPAYTAAKHGVIGLTRVAALENATNNIRVNAVCPGFIGTPMLEDAGLMQDEEMMKEIKMLHPVNRLGKSREISDAVTWLASDEASFTTGEALVVDGGYTAR